MVKDTKSYFEDKRVNLASFGKALGFIAICEGVGLIGSIPTAQNIPSWYSEIRKPSFTPPNWLFGPVWTILYMLMGIALYIVSLKEDNPLKRTATKLFFIQLALNLLWSYIFFGLRSPRLGFIEIVTLVAFIAMTIRAVARVSVIAAVILIPYLAWSMFATVLNFSIWRLNS
ncbi:TspO and MBR like protein [Thermobaculum terrenum ATCC BAA-798]|uniref:TspO and MBR like protein n=1 Tax=Thermobaculum terrenum (strain ATCC BAA-798 / CCMEE 7001 / YNP1) TaxID=525904 RepID=D1CB33_THET1|nr:TspO/MBR family protein [Thermobaculum terrenum]ACZ41998.1 TspO and MBR like protein [Thermobaculum terrenum ATCC BAA-798]